MKKRGLLFLIAVLACTTLFAQAAQKKVGLMIVATGRYIEWVQPLIDSADKHFLPDQEVTYFVFSDCKMHLRDDINLTSKRSIIMLYQERLGWPHDTMMRPAVYYRYRALLSRMDYLFATDADMLFVDTVGDEILGDRVATQHPGFVGKRGTYETRRSSTAYVAPHEGKYYFAGGFNGGTAQEYLKLCETVTNNIEKDRIKNIIAVWHDESHINRYFIDNPPTVIVSPSYCYPESWHLPYKKRLLALDKNHAEVRK